MAARRALRGGRRSAGTLSDDRRGATPHQRLGGRLPLARARRARDRRSLWRTGRACGFRTSILTAGRSTSGPARAGRGGHIVLAEEGVALFAAQAAGRPANAFLLPKDGGGEWRAVAPGQADERRLQRRPDRARGQLPLPAPHLCLARDHERRAPARRRQENLGHTDTRMVEKHDGHLAPTYIADAIRKAAPKFGVEPWKGRRPGPLDDGRGLVEESGSAGPARCYKVGRSRWQASPAH